MAIIADEVFLDFALNGERAASFAANRRGADVYLERALEDFRVAADEGCVVDRRRSGADEEGGAARRK